MAETPIEPVLNPPDIDPEDPYVDADAQPIADSTLRTLPDRHPGHGTPAVSQEFIRDPHEVDIRPERDHRPDPSSGLDVEDAIESFGSQAETEAAPLDDSMIAGKTREEVTGESVSPDNAGEEDEVAGESTKGTRKPDETQVSSQPLRTSANEGSGDAGAQGESQNGETEADSGPSRDELYEEAQKLDVEGRSTMNKEELAEAVEAAKQEQA